MTGPALALLLAAAPAPEPPPAPGCYGAEPPAALAPAEQVVLDAIRARHPAAPVLSPSLSRAARAVAARAAAGDGGALERSRVRLELAGACALDAAPRSLLVSGPASEVAARVARDASLPGDATHLGVGVAEGRGTLHAVVLASRRPVRLAPFPRDVAAGAVARLRAELVGLTAAQVFVTGPDGRPRSAARAAGSTLDERLAFPDAGRYVVEVLGSGRHGPEVAALLVVSAGGAALAEPARPPARADPPDDAAAAVEVAAAVSSLRSRHGLDPVEPDERLAALARAQSEAMRAGGRLAHVLPGSGGVAERLRRAGVPYRRALENLARGASALSAHESLEESPAHLDNLLDPGVTHLGVGIARGQLATGEPSVWLTEILIQRVDDSSGSRLQPEERVRQALWKERARLGRPALLADPRLDDLARRASREMLRRGDLGADDGAAEALALPRELAAADAFVATAPGEAARSRHLADPRFRRVGVGVTIGDSPRLGAGLLWIAVIYTD